MTQGELLSALAKAAKAPLDDMDKYQCWPPGQQRAHDHVTYYWLRVLIAQAEEQDAKH
jgi:hypothetical protein